MRNFGLPALFAFAVFATAGLAEAGTKSFVVNGTDLRAEPKTSEKPYGVDLSHLALNSVWVGFTLPKDYKKNSAVTLRLRAVTGLGTPPCDMVLNADGTYRGRPGNVFTLVTGASSGLAESAPGAFTVPATPNQMFTRTFEMKKATFGPILDQKAGDSIIALVSRQINNPLDTCQSTLFVLSAKITYTTD